MMCGYMMSILFRVIKKSLCTANPTETFPSALSVTSIPTSDWVTHTEEALDVRYRRGSERHLL